MVLFALSQETSDFLTVWGFVAGVFGCIVGLLGFGYTIYQVRKVQGSAKAAAEAATKTLEASKESYSRFVGAFASRIFSELSSAVSLKEWKTAQLRCHDLAELLAALPSAGQSDVDEELGESAKSLREFAQTFARLLASPPTEKPPELPRANAKKWDALIQKLHRHLDSLRKPFKEKTDG